MPSNAEIAAIFRRVASLLEVKGGNPFRVRAYEKAARNIEAFPEEVALLAQERRLREIPGIGGDLEAKIREINASGKLGLLLNLEKSLPPGVPYLLEIPSIGPKTARLLYEKAGVESINDLEAAIASGKLTGIPGIKEKTIANLAKGIGLVKKNLERMPLCDAESLAEEIKSRLPENSISAAGSLRRRRDTIGDIDFLAVSKGKTEAFIKRFIASVPGAEVIARGKTKVSLRTAQGIEVDLRVVPGNSYGAALVYFTGSQAFNVKLRHLARESGYKLNEYGLFTSGNRKIAGKTEEEIFRFLKMAFVPPEMREDRGEIELALKNKLPALLEERMIKGDLHVHSRWSDGKASIKEMAEAARVLGYSYIAVTDHSRSLKVAGGLDPRRLAGKRREIKAVNAALKGIRVLYGSEVEIGPRGELDYDDGILAEFDVVVAAVHTGLNQTEKQLTDRIVKACSSRRVHIIAHPTGRLRGVRDAYPLDLKTVFKAAADTNTHIEINAYAQRMDLDDINCRIAAENGVRLAINTDAHRPEQLRNMKYGVDTARRGWLGSKDVINTLSLPKLLEVLKK